MKGDTHARTRVPPTDRCACGSVFYFVRPHHVGEEGYFRCRRCGARYRMEVRWEPETQSPSTWTSWTPS